MLRRLPAVLVVGLVLQLGFDTVRLAHYLNFTPDGISSFERWELLESGFDFMTAALLAFGFLDLARGLRDREAAFARIAGIVQIVQVGIAIFWIAFQLWDTGHHDWVEHLITATRWLQSLTTLATVVAVTYATRAIGLGIASAVIAIFGVPVPPLGKLYSIHGQTLGTLLSLAPYAILSALWLAQVAAIRQYDEPATPPVPASVAFTRAANALWLRVIAALSIALITMLAAASRDGRGLLGLLKAETLLSPAVDLIALGMIGVAAMQLARARIAPYLTALSAGAAMCSVGMIAGRLPVLYKALYGDHDGFGALTGDGAKIQAIVVPLVAAAATALILMAVTKLARERQHDDMQEDIGVRTGVYVVLSLAIVFVVNYGLEKIVSSEGSAVFMLLLIAAASLYALALAAKICTRGAQLVDRDPVGLPSATLVKGGDV